MTLGHIDVASRAAKLCDELIVVVMHNYTKQTLFTKEERVAMAKKCLAKFSNIKVEASDGLLVDFMQKHKALAVVRGLRGESDFRYELEIAMTNKMLYSEYETILLPCRQDFAFTSSSVVKEVAMFGGDIQGMVAKEVYEDIVRKFQKG